MVTEIIWKDGTIETKQFDHIWTDSNFPNCLMYRKPGTGAKIGNEGSLMKDQMQRFTVTKW